ncbi:hypothetical protein HPB50_006050 [Hyalomma asiaticum]|uniref:Uncharacterized protein n=1 Tax=Hyalomma asiaticum TaxID=266040 RepID=A0ACB7SFA0_HYAAI|nr:hypothetical protein HPB50_006050 [Hyalomma asiaticum]
MAFLTIQVLNDLKIKNKNDSPRQLMCSILLDGMGIKEACVLDVPQAFQGNFFEICKLFVWPQGRPPPDQQSFHLVVQGFEFRVAGAKTTVLSSKSIKVVLSGLECLQIGFGVLGSLRTLSFGVSPPAFITTGNAPLTSLIGLSSAEFGIRSPLRPPALGSTGLSFGTGGPLTRSITGP